MNIFESIFSTVMSNLLSGFVGALLGALASFAIALYSNKKQVAAIEAERQRGHVSNAVVLAGQLFDSFLSYSPQLVNTTNFGMQIEESSLKRIKRSLSLYEEAKYLEHLLPKILRKRWDSMLLLISDFSSADTLNPQNKNRAQVDVENYINYVRDSCVDFLDGQDIRIELAHPFLKREDPKSWTAQF